MFSIRSASTALIGIAMLSAAPLCASDLWQLSSHALADFTFEGLALGEPESKLTERVPDAKYAYERVDARSGVKVYTVPANATADGACLYFFDDALYQMDIEYKKPRVEQMGGPAVLLHRLIASLGPPDYADAFRRTWHEPNCSRRADVYFTDGTAMLIITDTSRSIIADQRLQEAKTERPVEMGLTGSRSD